MEHVQGGKVSVTDPHKNKNGRCLCMLNNLIFHKHRQGDHASAVKEVIKVENREEEGPEVCSDRHLLCAADVNTPGTWNTLQ